MPALNLGAQPEHRSSAAAGRCSSANVARALREAQRRAVHGDGRSRRCTRSGTPSPRARCSPAKAWTRSPSSSATGTGPSLSDGVRPQGRRRAQAIDAPVADDGGVRRRPSGRAGRAARRLTASGCAGSLPSQLGRQRSTVQVAQPQPRKSLSAVSIAAPIDTAVATVGQSRPSRGTRRRAISRREA